MNDEPVVTCPTCEHDMDIEPGQMGEYYNCPQCHSQEVLMSSYHADEQWDDRSRTPEMFAISGWANGFRVPEPHGMEAEEVQYHHPSRQALLRKRTTIVTSISVPSGRNELKRAVIREMLKRGGHNSEIAELVNEGRLGREGLEEIVEATSRVDQGNGSASPAQVGGTGTPGRQRTQ